MAAGDINDPLSNIPNIALVDQSATSAAPGAGYGRVELVNSVLGVRVGTGAWVPLASLVAGLLTALTEKVSPAASDLLLLQDEADASALKKVQAGNVAALAGASGGLFNAYAIVADVKAHGTAGGTFTAGSWQTHDLQTEESDPSGIVSLASNHFVLAAGTYFVTAMALIRDCGHAQLRLRDITNNATLAIGTPAGVGTSTNAPIAHVAGRFTLGDTASVELQGRCETTTSTYGWGDMPDWDESIAYARVTIWREAA